MSTRFIHRTNGDDRIIPTPNDLGFQYDNIADRMKYAEPDGTIRALVTEDKAQTLTNKTLNGAIIDGVTQSSLNDRQIITVAYPIAGDDLAAGVLAAVQFPAAAIILRAMLDVTTPSTGACTVNVGYTAVSATTGSDTLLDGVDVNSAAALFDSMNAGLDSGANALAQKAASGAWVTVQEASGAAEDMVATLYVQFILA